MNHKEEIARALILCANLYLEMDMDSSDDYMDGYIVDCDDNGENPPKKSKTVALASLSVPKWSGDEYRMYLKMSAVTLEFVYQLLAPRLRRLCHGMPMVDARLQIMVALHKLTSSETYRDASAAFNMKKSTGYCCTHRVINALYTLAPGFLQWPSPAQAESIAKEFEELSGVPGIVGHVGICRLRLLEFLDKEDREGFLCQVICDNKLKIYHCEVASRLEQSNLAVHLNDPNKFSNNTHLIANNYYPVQENILVPYGEEDGAIKTNFNEKIRSAFVIEDCLGFLLGRFESLRRGLSLNEKSNNRHVIACSVLHNICLLKNDPSEKIAVALVDKSSAVSCVKGVKKRDAIAGELSR